MGSENHFAHLVSIVVVKGTINSVGEYFGHKVAPSQKNPKLCQT